MKKFTAALANVSVTRIAMLAYKAVAFVANIRLVIVDLLRTYTASWHFYSPKSCFLILWTQCTLIMPKRRQRANKTHELYLINRREVAKVYRLPDIATYEAVIFNHKSNFLFFGCATSLKFLHTVNYVYRMRYAHTRANKYTNS